jgi:hypothetical protein
LPCIDTLF